MSFMPVPERLKSPEWLKDNTNRYTGIPLISLTERLFRPFICPWGKELLTMKIKFFIGFFIICCSSCQWLGNSPSFGDDYITYRISKGNHEIDNNSNPLFTDSALKFQAIFDSTCIYQTLDPGNQYDINKLLGFSDCNSQHHENSARFGWNWQDNALHIYAYIYVEGQRKEQHLGTLALGKTGSFKLATSDDTYVFTFNGTQTIMPRHCNGGLGISYKLLPYFGGNEAAPQDITIKIRSIE
jgi:hypothetical protein